MNWSPTMNPRHALFLAALALAGIVGITTLAAIAVAPPTPTTAQSAVACRHGLILVVDTVRALAIVRLTTFVPAPVDLTRVEIPRHPGVVLCARVDLDRPPTSQRRGGP
jgi:hypothetical protein